MANLTYLKLTHNKYQSLYSFFSIKSRLVALTPKL